MGLSWADHIAFVFLFAIPLGLGAGAIDSALNHYVAHNYKAHHMNWLHAFWGVGAMLGPLAFAAAFGFRGDWHAGFFVLGAVQMAIVLILLVSLKLWSSNDSKVKAHTERPQNSGSIIRVLSGRKVQLSALAFLLYVGLEVAVGFWLASYLVAIQQFDIRSAAIATSLYYGAIMAGRLLTGLLSFRLSGAMLIRLGMCMSLVGVIVLGMGISDAVSMAGTVLIGLGFAPVYPNLIHATPVRFANESSQVMSIQMAAGYIGAAIFAPLVGLLGSWFSTLAIFIWVVVVVISIFFILSEWLSRQSSIRINR